MEGEGIMLRIRLWSELLGFVRKQFFRYLNPRPHRRRVA